MNINRFEPVISDVEMLEIHLVIRQIRHHRNLPSAVLLIKTALTLKWIGAKYDG